ncbi:HNH endonuclease [Agrobacterium cavarae]|uniref:HNH endonuclease n=1 Tax=Agrobacterium cavarae TaxID=2528239 RepID=UPI003FD2E6F9
MQRAHRVSWALYCHPITEAQHVLHTCDNRLCVNPAHLFLGDQSANMDDKVAKGRQDRGEKHGMAKLTEDQAIAIKFDARLYREIAETYSVSIMTVSDIKRGRSWKHLQSSELKMHEVAIGSAT